jgi:hypothetical protein
MGFAAYNGKLAMVEFLLGLGFDLEAKNNVRLHFSFIAYLFLFSSSVTGAFNLFRVLQMYECVEFNKTTAIAYTSRRQQLKWSTARCD